MRGYQGNHRMPRAAMFERSTRLALESATERGADPRKLARLARAHASAVAEVRHEARRTLAGAA